ncbi:MAG: phospholipid carrier-dependent glycosyltransferase [Anaerolineaceae bacterium]|nr:phospholipid carrier-dependent glycosyltransferase [Anaerolineaceae bacterium]
MSQKHHLFAFFSRRRRGLDTLWLLVLAGFIFAGMPLATFHGDEAMQIYMSNDYVAAFIDRDVNYLMVSPPYGIDEDPWLRILNGSVNRYAIGLSWQLAGMNSGQLPPRPGWDWGLDYDRNVETGHLPSEALLLAARFSSTLFLALSAWVLFGIGWQVGGRPLAYLASGLYTLNPVVLLNGRRAMQEGSYLFFGLLAVLLAAIISRKRADGRRAAWYWWAGLVLAGGLTLASKHSGIVLVAGAFGWIGLAELAHLDWRRLGGLVARLLVTGVLVVTLFVALSPALWNDPIARFGDLVSVRQGLLEIQIGLDPAAPTPLLQRVEGIVTQPFLTAPQHYEVAFWANTSAVTDAINRYMASPLSGVQFGPILGTALTLLAGWGLVLCLKLWRQPGILAWVGVTLLSLLVNPLPWQRYYLALYPVAALLAGIGLLAVVRWVRNRA